MTADRDQDETADPDLEGSPEGVAGETPPETEDELDEATPAAEGEAEDTEGELDEPSPAAEAEAEEADEPEDEPEEPAAASEEAAPATGGRRRRRAAEVTAGTRTTPAPRKSDGTVEVRAQAKYVRTAPRKARLVIDHIRGKPVDEARAILAHTPRAAAEDVLKLLDSCVANAENNHELVADELVVHRAYVDEGPTLKRYRPSALGRATRIRRRTSHMTITLIPKE